MVRVRERDFVVVPRGEVRVVVREVVVLPRPVVRLRVVVFARPVRAAARVGVRFFAPAET